MSSGHLQAGEKIVSANRLLYSEVEEKEMGDISGETISIIVTILVTNGISMALTVKIYIRLNRRFDAIDRWFDAFERRFDAMDSSFEPVERSVERRLDTVERSVDRRFERVENDVKILINDVGEIKGILEISRTSREREPSGTTS